MDQYSDATTKQELVTKLKNSIVMVKFKKVNGEMREMKCTLMEGVLPSPNKNDVMSLRKVREMSPEVLAVWDIDRKAWRSMRWNNIVETANV